MIAGDHSDAFIVSAVPALAVYVGTECAGTFGRYRYRFPIHEPLARALVEAGIERGVDLVYTQDAPLDYAFYVPLHFTMPRSEEHTSELQSRPHLVCRLLLAKKKHTLK